MIVRERLAGGLIVSVQTSATSPLAGSDTIALLARCAEQNGALGVRIEGAERIRAVRAAVALPIVGIVKREHPGFAPYITSSLPEVDEVAEAGADIVAFDATLRPHPDGATVEALVARAHERGLLAMADCADEADARAATWAGADVVATTLAGYTDATSGRELPALDLVARIASLHPFAVCEGGIADARRASAAFGAGARAIVVGTAITNVDALVRRFVASTPNG